MRDAVATLEPGVTIGPPAKGEVFLIVRLHERRPGRKKTFAEARPEIEQGLLFVRQQEALAAWLARREEGSTIEVYPETLFPQAPSRKAHDAEASHEE